MEKSLLQELLEEVPGVEVMETRNCDLGAKISDGQSGGQSALWLAGQLIKVLHDRFRRIGPGFMNEKDDLLLELVAFLAMGVESKTSGGVFGPKVIVWWPGVRKV
jgi:hypothetical protein